MSVNATVRAFATLPPGTVSPVMASTIIERGGQRQMILGHLRRRATKRAAEAARSAAEAARAAADQARAVAQTAPSDPDSALEVNRAMASQARALDRARLAEDAAYELDRLRRTRADALRQRRSPTLQPDASPVRSATPSTA